MIADATKYCKAQRTVDNRNAVVTILSKHFLALQVIAHFVTLNQILTFLHANVNLLTVN